MWELYCKKGSQELRPYIEGEDMSGISVNHKETPRVGGMIARDFENHESQWYITEEFFKRSYTNQSEKSGV